MYMADIGHFDQLVSGLSLEERQNLLVKLKNQSGLSAEPIYTGDDDAAPILDIEDEYPRLPWYYRLWYFILSLFKAKPPIKIFEDHQLSALSDKIEEKTPGLYDRQRDLLLPAFHRQMLRLKEAARFFYSPLDMSVNRDRGAFFAFLGSLEMPDVHKQLLAVTDPGVLTGKDVSETPETELRQTAFRGIEDALAMVNEDYRNTMYFDARSLACLKDLSSFLFDRVLMGFSHNSALNCETCSAGVVRDLLLTLNNILYSLSNVPPMALLESLFVFSLQERTGEPGFDASREIPPLLTKADESIAVIREFNRHVPLSWIIRCSTRNMQISPSAISGGEDWFAFYRDYWRRRVDSLFAHFMKNRRQEELINSFRYFLKGRSLKMLENVQSDSNPDGPPLKGAFALSFLLTFYSAVFIPDINKILRPILIDGEFQRKENRAEFAEHYNNLIKLEDEIKKLDRGLSPAGDYGARYAQARQDMSSLPIKRRKMQVVATEASEDAGKILEQAVEASRSMVNILNGILGKDSRAKYDTLANLSKMAGKDKDNIFIAGLNETAQQFQKVLKILDDIEAMESGR